MIQIQISIHHEENNIRIEINRLTREDTSDAEKKIAELYEMVCNNVNSEFEKSAKELGLKHKKKVIK
jgi:hypothetical protein